MNHRQPASNLMERSCGVACVEGSFKVALTDIGSRIIIGTMLCNLLIAWVASIANIGSIDTCANVAINLLLFSSCIYGSYNLVKRHNILIWTPMPWFLVASAAFYGVGPSLYYFGNQATVSANQAWYSISSSDLIRTGILNSLGIAVVYVSWVLACSRIDCKVRPRPVPTTEERGRVASQTLALFLIAGVPIKYFLVIPYEFGLLNFTLPGSLMACSRLTLLSSFLVAYLLFNKRGVGIHFSCAAYPFLASEVATALLKFNKTDLLLTVIMIMMGMFQALRKVKILIIGGIACAVVFACAFPFVLAGRTFMETSGNQGIGARVVFAKEYLLDGGNTPSAYSGHDRDEEEGWWRRLNYAHAQTFAMKEYDNWRPGDTFSLIFYVIIPRWVWPDKPVMTAPGEEFNAAITGIRTSKCAPGLFAEAYWNGGWLLVIATCVYVGILYGWLTRRSMQDMEPLDARWLPCALFCLSSGLRVDGWFVAEFVAPLVIALALWLGLKAIIKY